MHATFSIIFAATIVFVVALKLLLALRQIRAVARGADRVPAGFAATITPAAHRRAAAYTIARQQLGIVQNLVGAALVLALTLFGGLQAMADRVAPLAGRGLGSQAALVVAVLAVLSLADLPLDLWRQFRIEQRFGFNRMTLALYVADRAKALLLGALIGLPLLACVLWLMARAGKAWWFDAWLVWSAFALGLQVMYPVFIAPLFNRFTPLANPVLLDRIRALLERTGFAIGGVFTMDGSRRSSHGNAYFTGLGRAKRIVFFDTLLARLEPDEIEAVLAHELGHFKLRHVLQRTLTSLAGSLAGLAALGWLARQAWFYEGLGVTPRLDGGNDASALLLFMLVVPLFGFVLAPLASLWSRRHEFQADAFAARHASAGALVSALTKLYRDNAATLTPDPLHSVFYDSHPPAALRIARLVPQGAGPATA